MRVLLVHNRYRPVAPSGEDAVVDQEARALARRGHTVALFERRSADIASWSPVRRAALPLRVLWSEESRRSLADELVRFAPDVVHVHNTFPLVTPTVLYACRAAEVPVVATVHNYKLGCASGELFRDGAICHDCLTGSARAAVVHGCYRGSRAATVPVVAASRAHLGAWRSLVSAYVFVSAAQRDILAPLGLPAGRSFVKHNFVDPAMIASGAPDGTGAPDGAARRRRDHAVAFVGRLDPAKGASFLMRAWDRFRALRPRSDLGLVVAGGGPMGEEMTRWGAAHPSVTVAGLIPRDQVAPLLGRVRAAVVPSQWEETFGLVVAEAMAAGTPPIASAVGALPELIRDGVDGSLFPVGSIEGLVGILADVDDNPDKYAAMGDKALITYRDTFSAEGNIARLEEVYRFAIEHPPAETGSVPGISGIVGRSSW